MLIPTRSLDFHESLLTAGIPVIGVSGSGPDCRIDFADEATSEQRDQARQMAQAFDWTEPTAREVAIKSDLRHLDSAATTEQRVSRAINRLLHERLTRLIQAENQTRAAVRQIVSALAAAGLPLTQPNLPALEVLTWEQAVDAVRALLRQNADRAS